MPEPEVQVTLEPEVQAILEPEVQVMPEPGQPLGPPGLHWRQLELLGPLEVLD